MFGSVYTADGPQLQWCQARSILGSSAFEADDLTITNSLNLTRQEKSHLQHCHWLKQTLKQICAFIHGRYPILQEGFPF